MTTPKAAVIALLETMTLTEIAARLGVTEAAVRSWRDYGVTPRRRVLARLLRMAERRESAK